MEVTMRSMFITAATLAFCAVATGQPLPGTPATTPCASCGVVESVRYVEKKGEGSGAGLIAGGVVGGVLGHQIGSGRGNTPAPTLGAGAGADAGKQRVKSDQKHNDRRVPVRP